MERPEVEQPKEERKRPQHKVELEKRPMPQDKETYVEWITRIGGPNVRVTTNLDTYSRSGLKKEDKPIEINLEGSVVLNDENILKYFGKEGKKQADEAGFFNKEAEEYRIKKELLGSPDDYFGTIVKILGRNQKILVDYRFSESVKEWVKNWKEELKKKKPEEKPEAKKKETQEEKKREFKKGDNVMWESQGTFQWKKPKKIIDIGEHEGKKFALFEDSKTGISVDELVLEKPEKEKPKKKTKSKEKPKKKKKKESTLDEEIKKKRKEIKEIEMGYNIYYSPVVRSLMSLYYKKEYEGLDKRKKELAALEKGKPVVEKKISEPEILSEEIPKRQEVKRKDYLKHLEYTDNLFIEMVMFKKAVKNGSVDPLAYEIKNDEWGIAYEKTQEMYDGLSEKDQQETRKKRKKARTKNQEKRLESLDKKIVAVKKIPREMFFETPLKIGQKVFDGVNEKIVEKIVEKIFGDKEAQRKRLESLDKKIAAVKKVPQEISLETPQKIFQKAQEFWKLFVKKVGKETIEEVTKDAIEKQLEVIDKRLKKIGVIGRADLEEEQERLEKRLGKLEKI